MRSWKMGPFTLTDGRALSNCLPKPEEWLEPMDQLLYIQKNINWWIGDMVNIGDSRYGDEIYQFMPEGYSVDHIERCAKVAKAVPRSSRNPNLSWSHHLAVIGLEHRIQAYVLKKAEEEGWTSQELTEHVRKHWNKIPLGRSENFQASNSAGSVD